MRVLVTGASGFIGEQLCRYLDKLGFQVLALVRQPVSFLDQDKQVIVTDLMDVSQIAARPFDTVIHLAAKVHDLGCQNSDEYHRVNVLGTEAVKDFALKCGAEHFIFLSSVKALGEKTLGQPFDEQTLTKPEDDYGRSKRDAERALENFSQSAENMKISVVRVPLVYGKGVKANFLALMRLVQKVPVMPFAFFRNQRSVLGVDNLIDFLHVLLRNQKQLGKYNCYCIADEAPLSTRELTDTMKQAEAGTKLIQLPIPLFLLEFAFTLIGKKAMIKRLSESLEVSWEKAHRELGWTPKYSTLELVRKLYQG